MCYSCVMQKPPSTCPTCSSEVSGWVRTTSSKVTSPLKRSSQIGVVNCESAGPAKSIMALKVNLSSTFDSFVVPKIEATNTSEKKVIPQKPKPLQMEIYRQKESLLGIDHEDSNSDEDFQRGLVNFPPRPIIHRHAKGHDFQGSSSSELESGDEDVSLTHGTIGQKETPFISIGNRIVNNDSTGEVNAPTVMVEKIGELEENVAIQIEKENADPRIVALSSLESPGWKKQRKNPLDPNLDCQKRVTRGKVIDSGAKKVQKARRRKAPQSKVKSFNNFS